MHFCIPDGDEPAEWVDVRREREQIRRTLARMRRRTRRVDRRQYRGNVQRRRGAVIIWSPARRGTWHGYVYDTVGTRSLCGRQYLWPPRGVYEAHELSETQGAQVCRTCLRVAEQFGYLEASA